MSKDKIPASIEGTAYNNLIKHTLILPLFTELVYLPKIPGSKAFEGVDRWSETPYNQEGLNKNLLYNNLEKETPAKLLELDKMVNNNYIVPPISHSVFFTNLENPKSWKQLYIDKYTKTNNRLDEAYSGFKHYIWTNNPDSIPAEVIFPNVEVKTFDEFADHPLTTHLNSLLEEAKNDPTCYVRASDVARVITQQSYGGIYHDLDYEVFDAPLLINYMKKLSFFGGKEEEGRWDSFMGNAFIASTPKHPVINKLADIIDRNLKLTDAPEYIKFPRNKFDGVIFGTGPMALTMSFFKIQEQQKNLKMMMFPPRVLYNVAHARSDQAARTINPSPEGTVGGDMFSGNWGTDEYLKPIKYYRNQQDFLDESLLYATNTKDYELTEFLIIKGADIEAKDEYGRTPLLLASESGNTKIAKFLIIKGADIEAKDEYGRTPLLMAAAYGNKEIVELLLEKGANIEAKDNLSRTPLFMANERRNTEMATLLIEKNVENARKAGNEKIINLLSEHIRKINSQDQLKTEIPPVASVVDEPKPIIDLPYSDINYSGINQNYAQNLLPTTPHDLLPQAPNGTSDHNSQISTPKEPISIGNTLDNTVNLINLARVFLQAGSNITTSLSESYINNFGIDASEADIKKAKEALKLLAKHPKLMDELSAIHEKLNDSHQNMIKEHNKKSDENLRNEIDKVERHKDVASQTLEMLNHIKTLKTPSKKAHADKITLMAKEIHSNLKTLGVTTNKNAPSKGR